MSEPKTTITVPQTLLVSHRGSPKGPKRHVGPGAVIMAMHANVSPDPTARRADCITAFFASAPKVLLCAGAGICFSACCLSKTARVAHRMLKMVVNTA